MTDEATNQVERETELMRDKFSELLWIPHNHQRVSLASKESSEVLNVKHFRTYCEYHVKYAPYLIRLGLYQIAVMPGINIDAALIHALVERWRPETHTFHLPFGEMTVTLEDVSCLWGLPIKEVQLTGRIDWAGAKNRIFELLGIRGDEQESFMKKRGSEANEVISDWVMLKSKLRQRFKKLPDNADEQTVCPWVYFGAIGVLYVP